MDKKEILLIMEEMELYVQIVNGEQYIIFESCSQAEELEEKTNLSISQINSILECHDIFADEVFYCSACEQYHFANDGYRSNLIITQNASICAKGLMDNISEFIDEFINNPKKALPRLLEDDYVKENGWKVLDKSFNNGLQGDIDDPTQILNQLLKDNSEVVFYIDNINPYNTEFSCYFR